ncbi:Hypothetical protein PP7435_CHR4-0141 [Komagataella phaffii CBS 7435]|nr:GQ67_05202T0 [Komagataella phaffii]AOA70290.1 GQ68_05184T0 [Komagataella phaffii GS115]CAH2450511.1 Hypothetical protein BQ9382_C4-0760 [Komagataella phaffii CBS 7435]CCA40316.1 Hypothetical protein PP7435_CHR4-0141 [Komagataella phaffii CBS 7435]
MPVPQSFLMFQPRRRSSLSQTIAEPGLNNPVVSSTQKRLCYKCQRKLDSLSHNTNNDINFRRRSSLAMTGSFQESLLNGRTSGIPSNPIAFVAKISVTSSHNNKQRFYKHIKIPFEAVYYKWNDHEFLNGNSGPHTRGTPYVGNIDLEQYYIDQENSTSETGTHASTKREFPGYMVPPKGNLQLLIFDQDQNISFVNVFEYDISTLPKNHKTLLRQTIEIKRKGGEDESKMLSSTIQLKFANIRGKKFYLYENIRIIFQNRNPVRGTQESFETTPGSKVHKIKEVLNIGQTPVNIHHFLSTCDSCDEVKYPSVFDEDEEDKINTNTGALIPGSCKPSFKYE